MFKMGVMQTGKHTKGITSIYPISTVFPIKFIHILTNRDFIEVHSVVSLVLNSRINEYSMYSNNMYIVVIKYLIL